MWVGRGRAGLPDGIDPALARSPTRRDPPHAVNASQSFGVNITLLPAMVKSDYMGYAEVAVEEGIKVVETVRDPKPILLFLKENGVIVVHKCVTLNHALRAKSISVDCISIDGIEYAGHGGEYNTPS